MILRGTPTPTYAPEFIPNAENPLLQCLGLPGFQWLNNGDASNRALIFLSLSDRGFYQCVGLVSGQPETDLTGEFGSDTYLLVPGTYCIVIKPSETYGHRYVTELAGGLRY